MSIDKVVKTSENLENENLGKLREIFPQFVKENVIDFDALQSFFNKEGIGAGIEKYGLNWAGRSNAFQAIRTAATGTLAPQKDESKNWDETENIFIEGDNLEVLKLLQKYYREKIKLIYIDPPYNTGKDFVYRDNFTQGVADYYAQTGQTRDGIKMTANTEKNGRYHSDWLTMIYPRLFLARNLLKDDGGIFVSIDDNEVANLRLVMDEIFGEENFVGEFIRQSKIGGGSDSKYIVKEHEYCLGYAKDVNSLPEFFTEHNVEYLKRYKEEDENGRFFWDTLARGGLKNPIRFEVEAPDGTKLTDNWNRSQKTFYEDLEKGEIKFQKTSKGQWNIYFKQRLNEDGKKPRSLTSDLGSTIDGKNDIGSLFDDDKIFSYPKPIKLISFLANIVTRKNQSDTVLDFFAGSGTVAHAIMDLNADDGGNRKWVAVQLPEVTDEDSDAYKAGYKTISDISKERIRRAGEKIAKGDVGFKSYKLTPSNYRQWNELTGEDDAERLLQQSKLFAEKPLVDNYKELEVVYEILVKEGFDLNILVEGKKIIPGVVEYYRACDPMTLKIIYITFANKVTQNMIQEIGIEESATLVCFDNSLDDTEKINISRNINVKTI